MAAAKLDDPNSITSPSLLEETLGALCVAATTASTSTSRSAARVTRPRSSSARRARGSSRSIEIRLGCRWSSRAARSSFGSRATVVHGKLRRRRALARRRPASPAVDGLLADLGVSSPQLTDAERGMSFRQEGPLDMRMDPTSGETAFELIERLDQDELADVIYQYGEEHRSRRVARCIKQASDAGELHTTQDLRRAVVRATGPRRVGGVDPATRTFQALRILVNRELEQLEALLAILPRIVKPGGAAAIISFHSLEDRLVKRAFHGSRSVGFGSRRSPITGKDAELGAKSAIQEREAPRARVPRRRTRRLQ